MGTQAFWLSQSPPHFYVVDQTESSQVNHITAAPDVEFDVFAPPYKNIPVGKEFQAEVPPLVTKDLLPAVDSEETDSQRWIGAYVWCADNEPSAATSGSAKSLSLKPPHCICSCPIPGTLDCVQIHVEENRTALKNHLGNAFYEWGFNEMGECVAEKWTKEEELLFQQSIRKNPSAFWGELIKAFPDKEMQELVSYYFNVFVLRKRAIQNRMAPSVVDSDDDDLWVESEDEDGSGLNVEPERGFNDSRIDDVPSEDRDFPKHYWDGYGENLDDLSSESDSENENIHTFGYYESPTQDQDYLDIPENDTGQSNENPDCSHGPNFNHVNGSAIKEDIYKDGHTLNHLDGSTNELAIHENGLTLNIIHQSSNEQDCHSEVAAQGVLPGSTVVFAASLRTDTEFQKREEDLNVTHSTAEEDKQPLVSPTRNTVVEEILRE